MKTDSCVECERDLMDLHQQRPQYLYTNTQALGNGTTSVCLSVCPSAVTKQYNLVPVKGR